MPEINDYDRFLNPVAMRRVPSAIRAMTNLYYLIKGQAITLAEGMPNESMFPLAEVSFKLKDGTQMVIQGDELSTALQYLPTQGYPDLVKILKEFQNELHHPPHFDSNFDIIITNGGQDGISKTIELCLEPDIPILVPDPYYNGVLNCLKPYNCETISIPQDSHGLIPDILRQVVENRRQLAAHNPNIKMPRFLYVNPTGANPSGQVIPLERRREIYQIACEYDFLIFEDDPYDLIYFGEERTPSFQSLDVESRVIRFDSVSKTLSAGLRLGWVTGPKKMIETLNRHIQCAYLHTSSIGQAIAYRIFKHWGINGFLNHVKSVREFYRTRRDIMQVACERYLPGLCEWNVPQGGMFFWIKVCGIPDVHEMIKVRGFQKKVIFISGNFFMGNSTNPCNYLRASFSKASPEDIENGIRLLAELIREEHILNSCNDKMKVQR